MPHVFLPKNCSRSVKVGGSHRVCLSSESSSSRLGVALSEVTVAAPHSLCPPKLLCLLRDPYSSGKGTGWGDLVLSWLSPVPDVPLRFCSTCAHFFPCLPHAYISTYMFINALYLCKYLYPYTRTLHICVHKRLLSAQAGCLCACYEHSGDDVFLNRSTSTGALRAGHGGELHGSIPRGWSMLQGAGRSYTAPLRKTPRR